ncbi:hypothetical protein [Haloferax larsenii]|uniref:Uncharacterized protein n=1 Tax=Haloferax larsenii TaxID=302484 RepID=A0A1H7KXJ6_HALLR|nr:hypothetical protein [Haloferax larsenii]SEK91452.1 hypothetical protein SAMN04488691_102146 [Haloferax larsenii]
MTVRALRTALATLVAALWAVFGVYHVAMAVVTGLSIRGVTFGSVGLGAFALSVLFWRRSRRLTTGTETSQELVVLAVASLALILVSFTLLG